MHRADWCAQPVPAACALTGVCSVYTKQCGTARRPGQSRHEVRRDVQLYRRGVPHQGPEGANGAPVRGFIQVLAPSLLYGSLKFAPLGSDPGLFCRIVACTCVRGIQYECAWRTNGPVRVGAESSHMLGGCGNTQELRKHRHPKKHSHEQAPTYPQRYPPFPESPAIRTHQAPTGGPWL